MAIINCPECQGKVSTRAGACPHCGNPMIGSRAIAGEERLHTTQLTRKKYKAQKLIAFLIMVSGMVSCMDPPPDHAAEVVEYSTYVGFGGFTWLMAVSFWSWWQHG